MSEFQSSPAPALSAAPGAQAPGAVPAPPAPAAIPPVPLPAFFPTTITEATATITGIAHTTTINGVPTAVIQPPSSASSLPIAGPFSSSPSSSSPLLATANITSSSSATPSATSSSFATSTDSTTAAASSTAGQSATTPSSGLSTIQLFLVIFLPAFVVVLLASVLFWLWRIRKARRRDLQSLDTVAAREKGYQMTDVTPQSDRSFDSSLPLKSNSVAAPPRPDHDAPPLHRHLRAPSKQLQDSHGNPISAFAFPWSRGEREKRASRVPLVEEDTDTRPPTLPVLGFGEAVPLTTNESYRDPADTMPRTPALDRVSQMGPRQSIANTDPGSRYSEGPGPSVVGSVSPSEGRGFTSRDTRTSDFLPSSPAHQTEPAREQAPSRNLFTSPFTDRSGSGVAGAYEEDDVSDIDENERRKSRKDTDAASIVSELSEHGSGSVVPGSRTGTALGSYSRQGVHPR